MSNKSAIFLVILFVTCAAVANLARLLWDIPIVIGPWILSGWTGGLIYFGLGLMVTWAFRALAALSDLHPIDPPDL